MFANIYTTFKIGRILGGYWGKILIGRVSVVWPSKHK